MKEHIGFFFKVFLLLVVIAAIIFVRRMDQLSYKSVSKEEILELANEKAIHVFSINVCLPKHEINLLDSEEKINLKKGDNIVVLGVYKTKLRKGVSPLEYAPDQQYLIGLEDGSMGYGVLEEAAIGLYTMLPSGDSAIIKSIKAEKKTPKILATGNPSNYNFTYTIDGQKDKFAFEDLNIKYSENTNCLVYLGEGITLDSTYSNMSFFKRVKKFFVYDIRPITKKPGYFIFPRYQGWNEFKIPYWLRAFIIFLAYVFEILLIYLFIKYREDIYDECEDLVQDIKWKKEKQKLSEGSLDKNNNKQKKHQGDDPKDMYTIDNYKVKEFKTLKVKTDSCNPEDFVEVLNEISPEMGGVTNLGVFCDIKNIEQSYALKAAVEEQFINISVKEREKPGATLKNDGTSSNPWDFSYEHLLNDKIQ